MEDYAYLNKWDSLHAASAKNANRRNMEDDELALNKQPEHYTF